MTLMEREKEAARLKELCSGNAAELVAISTEVGESEKHLLSRKYSTTE